MHILNLYRATVLLLSLALFLSSVGIPVIIVACGMGNRAAMALPKGCSSSYEESPKSGERVEQIPCRMQYHFIEHNTTAYVPSKSGVDQPPLQILAVLSRISFKANVASLISCSPSESPPTTRDITILISTLLI